MSVKQRIGNLQNFGVIIMFSLIGASTRSFKPEQISYEIISRLVCQEGVFLKIEDGNPIVCANSLAEIKIFFNQHGITDLPGKKPCQPHCFRCNGKCLAKAA